MAEIKAAIRGQNEAEKELPQPFHSLIEWRLVLCLQQKCYSRVGCSKKIDSVVNKSRWQAQGPSALYRTLMKGASSLTEAGMTILSYAQGSALLLFSPFRSRARDFAFPQSAANQPQSRHVS